MKSLRLHKTARFAVLGDANEKHDDVMVPTNHRHQPSSFKQSSRTSTNNDDGGDSSSHQKSVEALFVTLPDENDKATVYLDVDAEYSRDVLERAFQTRSQFFQQPTMGLGEGMEPVELPDHCHFQWSEYERVDWTAVLAGKHGASSYCVRKGLSRKAQLAFHTHRHVCKNPDSILRSCMPQTCIIDTWAVFEDDMGPRQEGFADIVMASSTSGGGSGGSINRREILEQCLAESKRAMQKAEDEYADGTSNMEPTWILKPSTINKGSGIQIIHLYEQLVDICWSEENIREWVLQRYISAPLLLQRRKFHIRAYALAAGDLSVYLSDDTLVLCSGSKYSKDNTNNLFAHITNTAYQDADPGFKEEECIFVWNGESIAPMLLKSKACRNSQEACERIDDVKRQMRDITGELFRAYESEFGVFAPLESCFEHYGLDFIVDVDWRVYLLEVNPGPDFKQTGDRLSRVIERLMLDTIDAVLIPQFFGKALQTNQSIDEDEKRAALQGKLKLVYERHRRKQQNSTSPSTSSVKQGINMKVI